MKEEIKKENNNIEIKLEKSQIAVPEVNNSVKAQNLSPQTSSMQNMLVGVVGVLVIMAGIQVFQTQQLMAAVSNGSINTGTQTQENSGIGLPSQVGGCG